MDSDLSYSRDKELQRRLNGFLRETFQLPDIDYYGTLDLQKLLGLKSVLSDINNALTMRLTRGFVEWVGKALKLDESIVARIQSTVLSQKPNSNGYDLHHSLAPSFVAEIKCNVPINGGTAYGAAQKNGIMKDINALQLGKLRGGPIDPNALKFMVFLDLPTVRAANTHLISTNKSISKEFKILDLDEIPTDPLLVYGVYVSI